jgi:hypothetical protein
MAFAPRSTFQSINRRWFRWSLRTMFVVVTVFACWLGYELNWIRQRHKFLAEQIAMREGREHNGRYSYDSNRFLHRFGGTAPNLLWLFGEKGLSEIHMIVVEDDWEKSLPANPPDPLFYSRPEFNRVKSLFPEVQLVRGRLTWKGEMDGTSPPAPPPFSTSLTDYTNSAPP